MAKCEVCDRTLKTGRKYCHIHRGYGKERKEKPLSFGTTLKFSILITIYIVFAGFTRVIFGEGFLTYALIIIVPIAFFIWYFKRTK